jgi:hypothetical protein
MLRTAIVHNHDDLTLEALRETVAKATALETRIAPFQLRALGGDLSDEAPVVTAVHVMSANPICFRLPEKGEVGQFRESCQSLEKYSPPEWTTLAKASGCVFVETSREVTVHSRRPDMTVYSVPVLQPTNRVVQDTIWRVAEMLDALVLGENGQLIWRPGEPEWSEVALKGGRKPIAIKRE